MPRLSFRTWQELDLPPTEIIAVSGFSDAFLAFPYEVHRRLPDVHGDLVVLVGRKHPSEIVRELYGCPGRMVVVLKNSDAGVRADFLRDGPELPGNIVALFAANNELADPRAVSVPIGVRAANLAALDLARRDRGARGEALCYVNFTLNDELYGHQVGEDPHIRFQLADRLANTPWATLDISREPRSSPAELMRYYLQLARHRFVLSPQGRGVDCYRTWEALYMGAIPVVTKSAPMAAFQELPILFTDDYRELSEPYLERRWREMSARSYELDRMLRSWYVRRFLNAVGSLHEPRFICLWDEQGRSPESVLKALGAARRARVEC